MKLKPTGDVNPRSTSIVESGCTRWAQGLAGVLVTLEAELPEAELPPLARGRVAGNRATDGDRILFRRLRWCASASYMPVKDAK